MSKVNFPLKSYYFCKAKHTILMKSYHKIKNAIWLHFQYINRNTEKKKRLHFIRDSSEYF